MLKCDLGSGQSKKKKTEITAKKQIRGEKHFYFRNWTKRINWEKTQQMDNESDLRRLSSFFLNMKEFI